MNGPITYLAVVAIAQTAPAPAPAPSPPIKSGTFECRLFDQSGRQNQVTGELGNWRIVGDHRAIADLRLSRPDVKRGTLDVVVPMSGGSHLELHGFDAATHTIISGALDLSRGGEGMLTLSLQKSYDSEPLFAGFCTERLSEQPRVITK